MNTIYRYAAVLGRVVKSRLFGAAALAVASAVLVMSVSVNMHAITVIDGENSKVVFTMNNDDPHAVLTAAGVATDAILGASTIDALVARERYGAVLGCEPACSTDDGTYGRAGFCTPLVEEALAAAAAEGAPYDYVACCGPEPLMKIVAGMADAAGVFCEVSMERRMACGVGACLSCVVDTTAGKRRACVDGPVFCASEVVW